MDLKTVILVLAVYFIRPQDWFTPLIGVGIVSPIMIAAIAAMVQRARAMQRPITFMKSPLDWAMLAYYLYISYTSGDLVGTLKAAFPLFAFYFVTVQALDTPERLVTYLKAWMWSVFTLAMFGLLSLYGIDITGAVAMTQSMEGRLCLGTWMHDNPNSLGHTVFTTIPLAYYLYFWKKGVASKLVALMVWLVAFQVIEQTQSKGAVVAGFATLVLSFAFGKPRIVQIIVLLLAVGGGGAVMSVMPRMEKMGSLRSDEGVQGRLLAWEQARTAMRDDPTGQGWKRFSATIKWEKMWLKKATHSSYVKVGADLGYYGLFMYAGLLWLGFRALFRGRTDNEVLECGRRSLFVLICSYTISNWMIDRAYHTEFFLFLAAICAYYRMQWQKGPKATGEDLEVEVTRVEAVRPMGWTMPGGLRPAGAMGVMTVQGVQVQSATTAVATERPGVIDLVMAGVGAWLIVYLWDYILVNI
jgi:hypothetical protein